MRNVANEKVSDDAVETEPADIFSEVGSHSRMAGRLGARDKPKNLKPDRLLSKLPEGKDLRAVLNRDLDDIKREDDG